MSWDVETTQGFDSWFENLPQAQQNRIVAVVGLLREQGPALPRPLVDSIKGSRHNWDRWYREVIPAADDLFDEHLRRVRRRSK